MEKQNLFYPPRAAGAGEFFEDILKTDTFRVERIVSSGQATPAGQWYDQETDEWVVLLRGRARLRFETGGELADTVIEMGPGDHVLIPAHVRHRVEWTDPAERTFWLAVHHDPGRE